MPCHEKDPLACHAERQRSICGDGCSAVETGRGTQQCHAERQRSICGDGWLGGLPGRRPAAPLPTTNQSRTSVVGRGAADLRPGTKGPPNVFVMALPFAFSCANVATISPTSSTIPVDLPMLA